MKPSFPFTRRSHAILHQDLPLFSINLILGLSFCFIIAPKIFGSGISILDPDGFGVLGRTLYQTGRFESIQRGPLYPGLIAVVSRLVGAYSVASIQVVQCLLSGLSIVIARRIYIKTIGEGSRRAAWMTAAFPILIWYTARLWVETLLIFLLACLILLCISWAEKPNLKLVFFCGTVTGLDLFVPALNEFLANPWFLAKKIVINLLLLTYLAADVVKSAITGLVQLPFFILALIGTWRALKRRSATLWLLVPAGGLLLPTLFIFSFARLVPRSCPTSSAWRFLDF